MIYNTATGKSITKKSNYPLYVDSLRQKYSVRVEVKNIDQNGEVSYNIEEYTKFLNTTLDYLENNVDKNYYELQETDNLLSRLFVWFMDKQDATAFALKFGGKVV